MEHEVTDRMASPEPRPPLCPEYHSVHRPDSPYEDTDTWVVYPTVSLDFPHSWYINNTPITAFYDLCPSMVLYEREQPLWYASHSIRDYAQFRRHL